MSGTTLELVSESPDFTEKLGAIIGAAADPGLVVLLVGPLGAGKTVLARGVARGVGYQGYVRSPTFTLLNQYEGRLTVYHFDLYRLEHDIESEAEHLGFEEYFYGDGLCVVEWADMLRGLWPTDYLLVELGRPAGNTADNRTIIVRAKGFGPGRVLERLRLLVPCATGAGGQES